MVTLKARCGPRAENPQPGGPAVAYVAGRARSANAVRDPPIDPIPSIRDMTHATPRRNQPSSAAAPAERRNRVRLRDLCDEVLASFRAASAREVITEQERNDSRAILSKITGLPR